MNYRIYMIGFGGNLYCPFSLGLVLDDKGRRFEKIDPIYFDTPEEAYKFGLKNFLSENKNYVILPAFSI